MKKVRETMRMVSLSAALAVAAAAPAGAQGREVATWAGRVDQEVQITISGRNLSTAAIGPREPGDRRANVMGMIPRQDGEVSVQLANGRGSADVVRQPTAQNGYTTVIRVRDPQGGADNYRLNIFWQPVANGDVGPVFDRRNNRGNNNGRFGNRTALTWSGDVDDQLEIRVAPSGVSYSTIRGDQPRNISANFMGLPNGARQLSITQSDGRGSVVVVQQPSPRNGNVAVLRVRDPQGGYGHYSFTLGW